MEDVCYHVLNDKVLDRLKVVPFTHPFLSRYFIVLLSAGLSKGESSEKFLLFHIPRNVILLSSHHFLHSTLSHSTLPILCHPHDVLIIRLAEISAEERSHIARALPKWGKQAMESSLVEDKWDDERGFTSQCGEKLE